MAGPGWLSSWAGAGADTGAGAGTVAGAGSGVDVTGGDVASGAVVPAGAATPGVIDCRLDIDRGRRTVFIRLRYLEKPSGLSSERPS